jgi:hypothetical protein
MLLRFLSLLRREGDDVRIGIELAQGVVAGG